MDIEVPKIQDSQQDMDLIDILWRQDIDLGARREVFDLSHRQKEHALQRQREVEEEKRQQLVREQEKALLAQLQLDEETGEYVPRTLPAITTTTPQQQPAATHLEIVTQDTHFTENGDDLSFDECMQLLAETFPLVETTENTSACLDTAVVPAPTRNQIMRSPEQPSLLPPTLSTAPLIPQRTSPDLEQAWMELLSLPELQNCLNISMEDTLKTTTYPPTNSPKVQDPTYTYYPLPNLTDAGEETVGVGPPEFIHTFEEAFPIAAVPDQLSQMIDNPPQLNTNFIAEGFCDVYYPNPLLGTKETKGSPGLEDNGSNTLPELPNKPPYKPAEIQAMSPEEDFDILKQEVMVDMHDTDSGISMNTSPNFPSSPEKPGYSDGSYSYSDSDMDELDISPGSVESDYSEMFSLNFQPDDLQLAISLSVPPGEPQQQPEKNPKEQKTEPEEEAGYSDSPFTKDKLKRRSEVRLSRDEQRAKALQIPFTVDMIINLPVDDFNEMMSKHQLNEAQLALVRDIRRRGKNKVAAQNCRKRKMENIVGLEYDLDSLKDEKERLLREKSQQDSNLRKMKQQLTALYLEVFSVLRDEQGNAYSPSEYSLQQTSDGSVFLVPRIKKTLKSKDDKHLSA